MKYSPEELKDILEQAPTDEKGRPILSDEDFLDNLKELPQGTRSDTGKLAGPSGYVTLLEKGTQRAKEVAKKGGDASAETYARRKSLKESITILLNSKDKDGVSMQDKIVEAMANKAMDGCVGAAEFIRDTVGEKPSDNVSLDVMTDGDKELMTNLMKRLGLDEGSVKK
jgi:hypothetical protein